MTDVSTAIAGPNSTLTLAGRTFDALSALVAMAVVTAAVATTLAQQSTVDAERERPATKATVSSAEVTTASAPAETVIAGYFGVPYTYPSDVTIRNLPKTDVTVKKPTWDGKPFDAPVYYGVRVIRWFPGDRTGAMVDFTHSKTITRKNEEVEFKGLIDGAEAPARAKISAIFKHLEFSHGHNMLTFNGLFRLGALAPRLTPYVGAGVGVSLPHSEVQLRTEPARTYEYQYAGPVGQALIGLEIRLPTRSLFFEYKFSYADYRAPLTRINGNWLPIDLARQFMRWWRGEAPVAGYIETTLASHQVIGGVGVRIGGAAAARAR